MPDALSTDSTALNVVPLTLARPTFLSLSSGPGGPPGLSRAATPAAVFAALKRRWLLAVPIGLVLAAVASATTWTLRTDKLTSYTLLRVAQNEERVLLDSTRSDGNNSYTRTQLALIRSRPVLRAALKDERVAQVPVLAKLPEPVDWLEKELKADLIDGTEIIRLSLTCRGDAAGLATILNAVVDSYMSANVKLDHAVQLAHLNDLQRVSAAAEEKVRRGQEAIQGLTRSLNSGDAQVLSLKQRTLLDEYAALKRELAGMNGKRRSLEVLLSSYRSRLDPAVASAGGGAVPQLVELELDSDSRVQAQAAEVARSKEKLERLDAVAAPNATSRLREEFQSELAQATVALEAVRRDRRVALTARHQVTERAALEGMTRGTEVELAMLGKQRDGLQEELDTLRKEVDKLGLNTVELELRRSEMSRSETFLKSVWEQKERLEVELNAAIRQRVTVAAPAEDAVVLSPNARLQEAASAGAGGLLIGLLGVALLDLRRGRIHTPADVANGLRMAVLGSLPELTAGRPSVELLATAPTGPEGIALAEAADGVRTLLLQGSEGGRGKVLLIASPFPREGKTTLAASLAASLARSGHRTLLVDGDLRRPTLHTLFAAELSPGLSQALAGGQPGRPAVQPTAVADLFLLPAGAFDPAAVAALPRPAARELFDGLRDEFDFVVVDSSPLLCVPDGFMLGRFADGLVFSVRPGVSESSQVSIGYERVREHNLPFVGVVVNGVARSLSYYHSYTPTAVAVGSPA